MWQIVAIMCLVNSIDECRVYRFQTLAGTMQDCRHQGTLQLNTWGKQNKGWFIRRWDCEEVVYK